jgi:DNA primase
MSEFVAELKARADIVAIIGETVKLTRAGGRWVGLCPLHKEKTASFSVHKEKQYFYCFGCHAHGDVFGFLMQTQKLTFPEAVAVVADRLGMKAPRNLGSDAADGERAELLKIHEDAANFFRQQLHGPAGAGARAYLADRGVQPEAIATFGIGYAPDSGRALCQFLQKQGVATKLAIAAGLCQERRQSAEASGAGALEEAGKPRSKGEAMWPDLYDRFRGRIVFPINNERGKPVAFGARLIASDQKNAPKYLNSPETAIYSKGRVLYNLDRAKEAVRSLDYAILVEGYMDCMSVFMAGYRNVVAICGTALTSSQASTLRRLTQNVVLNLDSDLAGTTAAEKQTATLLQEGFSLKVLTLAGGLDPDGFIRAKGAAAYGAALKDSPSFFHFVTERIRSRYDLRRPQEKVKALNELLEILNHLPDAVTRMDLADDLAQKLQVESSLIRRQLRASAGQRSVLREEITAPHLRLQRAEQVVLKAWLEWDNDREALSEAIGRERLLAGMASEPIMDRLLELGGESLEIERLSERLEPSDWTLLVETLHDSSIELSQEEVLGAVEALRQRSLRLRRDALNAEMQAAITAGDRARSDELRRQLAALIVEFSQRHAVLNIRAGQAIQ